MAKEEAKYPGFIDYTTGSTDTSPWTGGEFRRYFEKTLMKHVGIGGVIWNVKDHSLVQRLMKEFNEGQLKLMVDRFIVTGGHKFTTFYSKRYDLWNEMNPNKDYGWDS